MFGRRSLMTGHVFFPNPLLTSEAQLRSSRDAELGTM